MRREAPQKKAAPSRSRDWTTAATSSSALGMDEGAFGFESDEADEDVARPPLPQNREPPRQACSNAGRPSRTLTTTEHIASAHESSDEEGSDTDKNHSINMDEGRTRQESSVAQTMGLNNDVTEKRNDDVNDDESEEEEEEEEEPVFDADALDDSRTRKDSALEELQRTALFAKMTAMRKLATSGNADADGGLKLRESVLELPDDALVDLESELEQWKIRHAKRLEKLK